MHIQGIYAALATFDIESAGNSMPTFSIVAIKAEAIGAATSSFNS